MQESLLYISKWLFVWHVYTQIYTILTWKGWARSQVRSIKFYIELPAGQNLIANNS